MGLVVVFLIWYFCAGRNNPHIFDKLKRNRGSLIGIAIFLSIFSGILPELLSLSLGLATVALPIYVVFKIFQGIFFPKAKKKKKQAKQVRNSTIPKEEQLPNAVPKRIKIIEKFNQKYHLNLTDSQIKTMVDASYISTDWELLIHSMTKEYVTIHQWFRAPLGGWLRVYLSVFNVQSVSSDMEQQKKICLDSFSQLFSAVDLSLYNTPAWDINKVNNMFMTNFDDTSFMIAYRFLEANGREFKLGEVEILKTDEELSNLKKKYDQTSPSGSSAS